MREECARAWAGRRRRRTSRLPREAAPGRLLRRSRVGGAHAVANARRDGGGLDVGVDESCAEDVRDEGLLLVGRHAFPVDLLTARRRIARHCLDQRPSIGEAEDALDDALAVRRAADGRLDRKRP